MEGTVAYRDGELRQAVREEEIGAAAGSGLMVAEQRWYDCGHFYRKFYISFVSMNNFENILLKINTGMHI